MHRLKQSIIAIVAVMMFAFVSCNSGPQAIKLGQDACSFCKMSIADNRFGAEIITNKGKVFKFDDPHCVLGFMKANTINNNDIKETYLVNFSEPHNFILAQKAFLFQSNELHSPMGGNVASFDDENKMKVAMQSINGEKAVVTWDELVKEK